MLCAYTAEHGTARVPAAHVHLSGKGPPRAGRKMGHVTRVSKG